MDTLVSSLLYQKNGQGSISRPVLARVIGMPEETCISALSVVRPLKYNKIN
jgi:hypothetical protein